MALMSLVAILAISNVGTVLAWRPIIPAHTSTSVLHQEASLYGGTPLQNPFDVDTGHQLLGLSQEQDQCALYKISMSQQLYFEYIHYKTDLPDMKEFTLCMWMKFHNHSNDHPLFSYAVGDQPRSILSWVANTPRSSYYMMNIDGHNLYRLNYPLRLNKWYHSCQSWNGRTGEWQIWVNDERVGRGFNNRLVGHVIKGGGIAISGQEQRQLGGGFLEGEESPPGSGGLLGELTMVQLYGAALTAGKAHKDHKHHHAHHYEHDTNNNRPLTTTRAPVTGPPLPPNPFLTGGQINTQVKINPGAPLQIVQNGVTLRHPAFPAPQEPPAQPFPPINPEALPTAFPVSALSNAFPTSSLYGPTIGSLKRPRIRFVQSSPYRAILKREKYLFKRDNIDQESSASLNMQQKDEEKVEKSIVKRQSDGSLDHQVSFVERTDDSKKNEKRKRGIFQVGEGLTFDDIYASAVSQGLDNTDYFSGLTTFGHPPEPNNVAKMDEREPAEAEVRMVMNICDGCAQEPFEKALLIGWRTVPKKIYSGALYIPATQHCKAF
ncbi:uncharacterized protein [Prorops nasuta]|uniref:uncharacterized protein n=1 Tax=Prorops nasuta TaxID=863751 RepID=UPI0034CE6798